MNTHPYKEVKSEIIGTTVSCHTLATMLNEIGSNKLSRKVLGHLNNFFADTKFLGAGIYGEERREIIGAMLIKGTAHCDLICPQHVLNVIRNVKLAYIKDLFMREVPLNYKNSHAMLDEYEEEYQ